MISEQLIRSGQAFIEGATSDETLLQIVSDSTDIKTKNYWRHIILVEVNPQNEDVKAHNIISWGSPEKNGKKVDFKVDESKVTISPVFFPTGGNPLHAQGFYGLPIYLVWEKHWNDFTESSTGVASFLEPRLEKTDGVELSSEVKDKIHRSVHEVVKKYNPQTKPLAVMILAVEQENSAFTFSSTPCDEQIAMSQLKPNHWICANTGVMLERIWKAKQTEGAEKGELAKGICAFTGERGYVVSGDNKAWPWFTTTWEAPFPETFGKKDHVKRLAFSPEIYKNLTVGATLFSKLTKNLDFNLNKQLFAPVDSAGGRETASKGQVKSTVFGSAVVTPLLDATQLDEVDKERFSFGLQQRLEGGTRGAKLLLNNLLGYDDFIPEEMTGDHFRLTSFYFSGDPSRADIYLHATIEDVIPSVLKRIDEIVEDGSRWSGQFYSDAQAWLQQRMKSLPFLLVTAYGPASIWQNMSSTLHTEALAWTPFVRGVAHRCNELSHDLLNNSLQLRNEAVFYAIFRRFFHLYHQAFELERRPMRPWEELVKNYNEAPISDMEFRDVEEFGFAAGYFVKRFSHQYYRATGGKRQDSTDGDTASEQSQKSQGKDYLKHRVMTFGSSLTPDAVYTKALGKMRDFAFRVNTNLNPDFEQRVGIWLATYPNIKEDIRRRPDDFMAAFWAGYMLGKVK